MNCGNCGNVSVISWIATDGVLNVITRAELPIVASAGLSSVPLTSAGGVVSCGTVFVPRIVSVPWSVAADGDKRTDSDSCPSPVHSNQALLRLELEATRICEE